MGGAALWMGVAASGGLVGGAAPLGSPESGLSWLALTSGGTLVSLGLLAWSCAGKEALRYTDKKENLIFLIYKEIQNGAVAKSYMTNGLFIYGVIFWHFLI